MLIDGTGSKPKVTSQKPSSVVISSSTKHAPPSAQQPSTQQGLWSTPAPSAALQAAALPQARTLAEIEQELLATRGRQPMTLEEIEREMRRTLTVSAAVPPPPQGVGMSAHVQEGYQAPPLAAGYQSQFPPAGFPALGEAQDFGRMEQMRAPQQQMYGAPPAPAAAAQGTANPELARMMGDAASDEERMNIELERKIRETEVAEGKRRRKAEKIAGMARYNDIMTQGESALRRFCVSC
jgi:hypothetical protein